MKTGYIREKGPLLGWALLCLLAGCSTPESRIKENPALFATFPPNVQQNIRQGRIEVGYTPDMVYIALGKADREYARRTEEGTTTVWAYVNTYTTTDRQRVNTSVRVREGDGYRTVNDDVWVDVQQQHEYEKMRVEFRDGKVIAIETLNR